MRASSSEVVGWDGAEVGQGRNMVFVSFPVTSQAALFFRHGGRIDRPYGKCKVTAPELSVSISERWRAAKIDQSFMNMKPLLK
jgi:hypothetical protein